MSGAIPWRQWWPWLVARRGSDSMWDAVLVPARAAGALQLQAQPAQPAQPHRDVPCRRPWAACCLRTGGAAAARLHVGDADVADVCNAACVRGFAQGRGSGSTGGVPCGRCRDE